MSETFPKRKDLFDAWHKAMVAGATVDKPNYGKNSSSKRTSKSSMKRRRAQARRRRKRAKKVT